MKKVKKDIEKEIQQTISVLDQMEKAAPKPFFYTRLQAKLESQTVAPKQKIALSPVLVRAFVTIVVFLTIINIFALTRLSNTATSTTTTESQTFIQDYYPEQTDLISMLPTSNQ